MKHSVKRALAMTVAVMMSIPTYGFGEEISFDDEMIVIDESEDSIAVDGMDTFDDGADLHADLENEDSEDLFVEEDDKNSADESDPESSMLSSFYDVAEIEDVRFTIISPADLFPEDSALYVEKIQDESVALAAESVLGNVETHRLYRIEVRDGMGDPVLREAESENAYVYVEGLSDFSVARYDDALEEAYEIPVEHDVEDEVPYFRFEDSAIYDLASLTEELPAEVEQSVEGLQQADSGDDASDTGEGASDEFDAAEPAEEDAEQLDDAEPAEGLAEGSDSAEPVPEAPESAAFDQSETVDGVTVNVQADEGAFPSNAVLSVRHVYAYRARQAGDVVDEVREEDQNVAASYVFDIKVTDPETGTELQPAEGYDVQVSFELAEAADDNLETSVYHITGTGADMTAMKLADVEVEGETVTAVTDGFSLYTVEFTYNDMEYVLPGDSSASMSDILSTLCLTGEVTAVQISNQDLFTATQVGSEWVVEALKPFSSTEWMDVTINDVVFHIIVSDSRLLENEMYYDADGTEQVHDVTVLTDTDVVWNIEQAQQTDGWYIVNSVFEINNPITVTGDVHLILKNASRLTANNGITVSPGHSLTIYAQSKTDGMGSLVANGTDGAIVGENGASITINGGNITAVGGSDVGIGGNGAQITINGGIVEAVSSEAAGIGCNDGNANSGTTVNINRSAFVKARGGDGKAGIGSSGESDPVNLIVGDGLYVYEVYFKNNEEKKKPIDRIDGYFARTNYMQVDSEEPEKAAELLEINESIPTPYYNDDTAISQWVAKEGTLKLYRDIKLLDNVQDIDLTGKNYQLDLNGFGLIYSKADAKPVITVESGARLELIDSNSGKVHRYKLSGKFATVNDKAGSPYSTFKGGYITGGTAGGVNVEGTFIMPAGTIIGNNNINGFGGGVVLSSSTGKFTMSGGAVIGNGADAVRGSGVYVEDGKLIVYGSPQIIDNVGSNVYLSSNDLIYIDKNHALAEGMNVGVTMQENGEQGSDFTSDYNYDAYGAPSQYFTSDATVFRVLRNVSTNQVRLGQHKHEYSCESKDDAIIISCANHDCGHEGDTAYPLSFTIPDPYVYGDDVKPVDLLDADALAAFNEAYYEETGNTVSAENDIVYYKDGTPIDPNVMPTDAGKYTAELKVQAIDSESGNYIRLTKDYTILQKDITITGLSVENKNYDGTNIAGIASGTLSLEGVLPGDQVELDGSPSAAFVDAQAGNGKAVTIGVCSLKGKSAENYNLTAPTGIVADILPKTIDLVWSDLNLIYNGGLQAPTVKPAPGELIGDDTCVVSVDGYQKNASTDAYTARAVSLSNSNYALPENRETTFTINPRTVELGWSNTNPTYNGTEQKPQAVVTNRASSHDTCIVTVKVDSESKNAGSYTATASAISNSNYVLPASQADCEMTFTINPKTVNLVWGETTFIYDGTSKLPTAEARTTDLISGDTCTVTVEGAATEVGTYTATATGLSNPNYALPFQKTRSFSIGKVIAELEWGNVTSFDYDGTSHAPTVKVTNLMPGDTCDVTVTGAAVNAGSYTARANALSNPNYLLPSEKTKDYTIKARTATLNWTDTSLTYNGSVQGPKATVNNLVSGDYCTVTVGGKEKDAGSYTATATKLSNTNYVLSTESDQISKPFTIGKKTAELSWSNTSVTYNGEVRQPTVKVTNLASGDTCDVTLTFDREAKNAGSYTVTASGLTNQNYALSAGSENTRAFEIKQKTVGLTWGSALFVYDGQSHAPSVTATGIITGDDCTVEVTGAAVNAGSHTAKASGLSNLNYALPSATTNSFKIDKKTVGLTWGDASFAYDGQNHAPTVTVTDVVQGDTCTVTVTGENKNAGTHTATAQLSNNNYELPVEKTKQYTIAKKPVVLTWTDTDLTYSGKTQQPKASVNELVSGDTCTVTVSGGKKDVGSYTATAASLSNNNYELSGTTTQAYSIKQKPVELTWKNTSLTYNGNTQQPTVTLTGVVSGDTCTVTMTGGEKDAGSYTAEVTALSNANYVLPAEKTQAYTIKQKPVTLTWGSSSFSYDGMSHVPAAAIKGVIDGDACSVNVSGAATNAGSHTATAGSLSNNNYVLSGTVTKAFTISKKTVGLTWSDTDLTYNKKEQKPTVTVTDLVSGDSCSATITGAATKAGKYTARVSALSNTNYALPSAKSQSYTISQKPVTVTWKNTSFVYDKKSHVPEATASGVIDGDTCKVTVTGAATNVGSYTATATRLSNSNYVLTGTLTQSFEIVSSGSGGSDASGGSSESGGTNGSGGSSGSGGSVDDGTSIENGSPSEEGSSGNGSSSGNTSLIDSGNSLLNTINEDKMATIPKKPTKFKAKAKKGKAKLSWKKLKKKTKKQKKLWKKIKSIEIRYSTEKSFAHYKTKKIGKSKKKYTLKGLKKGKVYYIKIRYRGKKGAYSKWSTVKKVRAK